MNSDFLPDLSAYLVSGGIASGKVFRYLFGQGANGLVLRPTGGPPEASHSGQATPTVQITVRDPDPDVGAALIWQAYNLLHNKRSVSMGSHLIAECRASQAPFSIGTDEAGRLLHVCNFQFWVKE